MKKLIGPLCALLIGGAATLGLADKVSAQNYQTKVEINDGQQQYVTTDANGNEVWRSHIIKEGHSHDTEPTPVSKTDYEEALEQYNKGFFDAAYINITTELVRYAKGKAPKKVKDLALKIAIASYEEDEKNKLYSRIDADLENLIELDKRYGIWSKKAYEIVLSKEKNYDNLTDKEEQEYRSKIDSN